jgi:hypothetical protein
MYSENLSIETKSEEISMFDKRTVVELNEGQMTEIDGGYTPVVLIVFVVLALKYH